MTSLDHIYVIHALKGYEIHKSRLEKILPCFDIPYSFVTDGDPLHFSDKLLQGHFTETIANKLSEGVISCTLNHMISYEKMLEAGHEFCLVLENDPFFVEGFRPKVDAIITEARNLKPGFIISLENTTLRFPPRKDLRKDQLLYSAEKGRAAGAYIIDRKAVENILSDIRSHKCDEVIDWWHNEMLSRGVIDMYWAHPTLTEQGSHNGKMHAVISSKSSSIFRQLAWKMQKFYKLNILHKLR